MPLSIFIGKSPPISDTCQTHNIYHWYYSANSDIATVIWSVQLAFATSFTF